MAFIKSIVTIVAFLTLFGVVSPLSTTLAQTNETSKPTNETNQEQTFRSAFDTFVTSEPKEYGKYQERGSNVFWTGEPIFLYIEPVGFKYNNLTEDQEKQLISMTEDQEKQHPISINFEARITIYDKDGDVLLPLTIPIPPMSFDKNKVFIPFTLNTYLFPGEYLIKYSVRDDNSGNVFDLNKNITIS